MTQHRLSTEERKKEILDAALEIISSEGFYNLTIRNIASKINISEAAVYRHFKNKKEIIDNLTDLISKSNNSCEELDEDEDLFNVLKEIILRQFGFVEKNPLLTSIIFQEEIFREYPTIRLKLKNHRKHNEEWIKQIIVKGKEKEIFAQDTKPSTFTLLYIGAIRMSVMKWRSEGFSYSLIHEVDKITAELFKILKISG